MSSADHGYTVLRREILEGRFKPGDPLKERDLVKRLGISRTPVREALRRLVADGLAEMHPRRSIVVSSYSEEELREIYELGSVLEAFVASLAAEKASGEDIAILESLQRKMEQLVQSSSEDLAQAYAPLDQEFHRRITSAARNSRIAQLLRQSISMRLLNNVMARYTREDFGISVAQHRAILDAIAARDAKAARQAMTDHITSSQGRSAARMAR